MLFLYTTNDEKEATLLNNRISHTEKAQSGEPDVAKLTTQNGQRGCRSGREDIA